MSWKMNFIFSLHAREIPIIETFYANTFQNIYSNFLQLNHEEKLTKILNPSTLEQIRTVFHKTVIRTERGRLITVIIAVHVIVFCM